MGTTMKIVVKKVVYPLNRSDGLMLSGFQNFGFVYKFNLLFQLGSVF